MVKKKKNEFVFGLIEIVEISFRRRTRRRVEIFKLTNLSRIL